MKRAGANIIFFLYLFCANEPSQPQNVTFAALNCQCNQKDYNDLTLQVFLDIKYIDGRIMEATRSRDKQFPAKRVNHHVNLTPGFANELPGVILTATATSLIKLPEFMIVDDKTIPSKYLSAIFQPPRT